MTAAVSDRDRQLDNAIWSVAPACGADPAGLVDSISFRAGLADADPSRPDFTVRVRDAVLAAVAPAPAAVVAEAPPAPLPAGEPAGDPDALSDLRGRELLAAIAEGQGAAAGLPPSRKGQGPRSGGTRRLTNAELAQSAVERNAALMTLTAGYEGEITEADVTAAPAAVVSEWNRRGLLAHLGGAQLRPSGRRR